ncbi:MAG: hypothetical protein ACLR4Z_00935 [Butyricicoccaceae bacterium]
MLASREKSDQDRHYRPVGRDHVHAHWYFEEVMRTRIGALYHAPARRCYVRPHSGR